MRPWRKNAVFLLLFICIKGILSISTLSLIHVLFRHGERSPTDTYKSDPYVTYQWPGGWGALNNNGKLQLYNLGLKLRNQYSGFIKEYYSPDDVYVLSSYADRCQMSAQCLLAGLYPPKDEQIWNSELLWQPIPIHSLPRSDDNIIAMRKSCPRYENELHEAYQSDKITKLNKDNKELFEYVSSHAGEKIQNITGLELMYNTLDIEKSHGLTLPAWTESIFPDKLKALAAESLAIFTQTDYMRRMKGGVFIKEVMDHMKAYRANVMQPQKQMYLYSGHDITVVNVMRGFGFYDLLKPDYGAHLILELHNISNKFVVKMMYYENFESVTPQDYKLESCGDPCYLDDFIRVLDSAIPKNWQQECELI